MTMSDCYFSLSLSHLVCVIERIEVWGQKETRIWDPATNQVSLVPDSDLVPHREIGRHDAERTLSAIASARIREALASELLVSPLEAAIIPLPHQIRALARATSADRVRFLLADEVGLGKTIEAGLILRELKLRGLCKRALVVAPKGLVLQWAEEMRGRFHEEFHVVQPADLIAFERMVGTINPWQRYDQVIVPMDTAKPIDERHGWSDEQISRRNQSRFHDLLTADWDLIIVDEAHRVAGSQNTVARYQLGKALAAATPYLLLLSATPHSGKSDSFRRLMNLLDERDFPLTVSLSRNRVAQYVIRTEKRRAVNANGNPLFVPRHTRLLPVCWKSEHRLQEQLYESVSEYVRVGYNRARAEKRNYVGFLLLLMQRLVASSTHAIRTALERRRAVLLAQGGIVPGDGEGDGEWETEWLESDTQEQLDDVISRAPETVEDESHQVERLLSLARQCELARPDIKAEALLDLLAQLEREEEDQHCKFLIFTEFVPTQAMLYEYLSARGYTVTMLNGSMDLDERRRAQEEFADSAQILVSTDAGGEGLNLQCAHIAINYDLPWSPTKIEQRIGRVDRIGQTRPVRAFNFVIENSVDHRIQQVLADKLAIILAEFGVDKTSDILDSADAEADFDRLYREALLHPEQIEEEVDELLAGIRRRTTEARDALEVIPDEGIPDISAATKLAGQPLSLWIESLYVNALESEGGIALQGEDGYKIRKRGESVWELIRFHARSGTEESGGKPRLVGLDDPWVQSLLHRIVHHVKGQPIPSWAVAGLAEGVTGLWSLWRVSLLSGDSRTERMFPLFVHDDGRMLAPSARHVWEALLRPNIDIRPVVSTMDESPEAIYVKLFALAQHEGEGVYRNLTDRHTEGIRRERDKGKYSFAARRSAIERIGLENVRQKRLNDLDEAQRAWKADVERKSLALADLNAIAMVHVEPRMAEK